MTLSLSQTPMSRYGFLGHLTDPHAPKYIKHHIPQCLRKPEAVIEHQRFHGRRMLAHDSPGPWAICMTGTSHGRLAAAAAEFALAFLCAVHPADLTAAIECSLFLLSCCIFSTEPLILRRELFILCSEALNLRNEQPKVGFESVLSAYHVDGHD